MGSLKTIITKTAASFFCGHALEMAGCGRTLDSVIAQDNYFLNLLPGFAIAYVIWTIGEKIHRRLDVKCDWIDNPFKRIFFQISAVITLTIGMLILTIIVFTFRQGFSIYSWSWAMEVALTIFSFTLFSNLLMVLRTLYSKLKKTEALLEKEFPYFTRL